VKCYNDFYKYKFRLSSNIIPSIICVNSRIWKGKEILKYTSPIDWSNLDNVNLGNFNNQRGAKIFARNWNLFNYMSGMGGARYSS